MNAAVFQGFWLCVHDDTKRCIEVMKSLNIKKMQRIYRVFFLLILLSFLIPENGFCFSARAEVDRNTISKNDSLMLKIVTEGGKGEVDISPIVDFKVISRGTGTNVSIINGKYSKTSTHTYLLFPLKAGILKIPSLTISQGNNTALTRPINIKVTMSGSGMAGNGQENTGDIFARAHISSPVLYTGQQAVYTFKFYAAVNYSNAKLDQPSFKGFSAKEAGKRKKYTETINGRLYQVTEIDYVLIPEKTGKFEIEPAVVMCEVPNGKGFNPFGDSFFNNNFFAMGQTRTKRVATGSVKVVVKPLPLYNGKGEFSGLVGKFSLGAGLDRTELKTGDSATLTITISGTGNIKDAVAPQVHLLDGLKVYDDNPEKKITMGPGGYTGSKIFKKAIVPVKPGVFTIDPVNLTYFDVQSGQYETISTPAMKMIVTKSDSKKMIISGSSSDGLKDKKNIKKSVKFTGRDILDLKEGSSVLIPERKMSFTLFAALMALPCVVFFIFKGVVLFMKREKSPAELMEKKAAVNLKLAEKTDLSDQDFLRFLYTAVVSKIFARGNRTGQALTTKEASEILISTGCPEDTAKDVSQLLIEIENSRYGGNGITMDVKKDLLKRTRAFLKIIGLMIFCFSIFWAVPGVSQAADKTGSLFLTGVKNYQKGNYKEAADDFEHIAADGIKTGALYYNIGNSYFKAGKIGLAILWYERAKQLIPHDPDLKFNLDYANTFVKDKQDNSNVEISDILFFWEDFIPSGVLQAGAIGCCFLFFLYAGFRTLKRKNIFTPAGVLLIICLGFLTFAACYDFYYKNTARFAVVVKDKAAVRSGFSDDSTKLFVLHSGTRVKVERTHGRYLMIFFSKGKMGWVRQGDAEII